MSILIVGNVIKDVYLNLDSRSESFESDKNGVKWLDFSFNASEHHFFNRTSNFGGAAISLQVLTKMGLSASVAASDFAFTDSGPAKSTPPDFYRYILTSDDNVSYLVPSLQKSAQFVAPNTPVDYLYIDRSAHLDAPAIATIKSYLSDHMGTGLILYVQDLSRSPLAELLPSANLIFSEVPIPSVPSGKVIYLYEDSLKYGDITEPVTVDRIDRLTHLSAYSIAAATILGGFVLGRTVESSLKLARANLENSTLDSVLDLTELDIISAASPESLELIAATLMAPSKGILAADESGGSIHKKFLALSIPDTSTTRHDYRNIFFTTPDIEQFLSGVILFDETARDFADTGESVPDFLISRRIIPGIKVDAGLDTFANLSSDSSAIAPLPDETYTKGLSDLPAHLREYYEMGLRFAKWRAAFKVSLSENGKILTPTIAAISENCRILAEYARDCQSAGLVPIVEPEVVYDGNYSITKSAEITGRVLDTLFKSLTDFGVNLRACILKVNMVLAGKQYAYASTPEEVGRATAEVLRRYIPRDLAGVVFLSGGQTPAQATANLTAIIKNGPYPWPLTFSFARALQDPALEAWRGDNSNIPAARSAFHSQLEKTVTALQ